MPAATSARPAKTASRPAQPGAARNGIKRAAANGASGKGGGFHPLQWVKRFFTKPLKLKRIGLQLHVVFDQSRLQAPNSQTLSRGEMLRLGHLALQNLLRQHEDARHVVPHLSHLEHALERTGSRALTSLPVKVLKRAMDQLDMIEGTEHSEELMMLRIRVDEQIRRRTPVNMRGDIANIEVRDASHSQYDEVESHWTGRVPLDETAQDPPRVAVAAK